MTRRFPNAAACALVAAAALTCIAQSAAMTVTKVAVSAGKPSEFRFVLSRKAVPLGTVAFTVTNKGVLPHTFKVCSSPKGGSANACSGKVTKTLDPGQKATLTYVFKKKGRYEYLCTIPGHAQNGMKGVLKVT